MLKRIEKAVKPFPKAAMFELFESGFTSLFEQLVSCIISIRTLDETTIPVSLKLFEEAPTPEAILGLGLKAITELLHGSTFPEQKAATILRIAKAATTAADGLLPADYEQLTSI